VQARVDRPGGVPAEMLIANRAMMATDMGGWIDVNSPGYWGTESAGTWPLATDWTKRRLYETPLPVLLACNATIVEADLRADLAAITVPTLVIHGDADISAPIDFTGRQTAALVPGATLVVIAGAGHGMYTSFAADWRDAVLEFATSSRGALTAHS
jgi:non-heme chloroperoxidase